MPGTRQALSADDRALVLRALRHPRGRYVVERASQLSGVPARTLYDWSTAGVLVPDWMSGSPRSWSYRDVVYARLLAWLRSKGMDRGVAAGHVTEVRMAMATARVDPAEVRSDGSVLLLGREAVDRLSGQQVFDGVLDLLDVFELTEPIEGLTSGELRGPSLVRPSAHTFISPWVLAGEPCVEGSRVASSTLHALSVERGLSVEAISELYPTLRPEAIEDAIVLEAGLRAA